MFYRYLVVILGLSILIQISFSIYYSSEIINQNNAYYNNQTKLQELKEKHQTLENELYTHTSINTLREKVDQLNLLPINKYLNPESEKE